MRADRRTIGFIEQLLAVEPVASVAIANVQIIPMRGERQFESSVAKEMMCI
jgi:hypothetical protein